MNIVLIGMRGSGKTAVGRMLAQRLGCPFTEMDELIVKKAGMSIPEIVSNLGWDRFRDLESEVCREVAGQDNMVNATGGGVVTRPQNISELKKNGKLVWLDAGVDTLLQRTGDNPGRPSLTGRSWREDMAAVMAERHDIYHRAADFIINTEGKTIEQIVAELVRIFGPAPEINARTTVCGIIGDPVEHSMSPAIHNRGYRVLGLNFVYTAFKVTDVRAAIKGIRSLGMRGVSVTIPHKITAMKYVDDIEESARQIGAINTIVNNDGRLTGYNTDCDGAVKALEEKTAISGKKAVLIGAGGAARAIAVGLKKSGARLIIVNRTPSRAARLARLVSADGSGGPERLEEVASADILVNATSVGMWPNAGDSPVPAERLHPNLTVMDAVYNPRETRLIAEARKVGAGVVYGDRMLLFQAVRQFELFTGCPPPLAEMESALAEALQGGKHAASSDRR